MSDLEARVRQFNEGTLPGQPLGTHMGTMYLVNDLWSSLASERQARETAERERDEARELSVACAEARFYLPEGKTIVDFFRVWLDQERNQNALLKARIAALEDTLPGPHVRLPLEVLKSGQGDQMSKGKHLHREAFRLMQYQCTHCQKIELIYNTRDGVTPFIVNSLCCKASAEHINWAYDLYLPNYPPPKGTRVFRNGTDDEARAIMRRRVSELRIGERNPLTDADADEIVERCVSDTEHGEFQSGWPMIVTVGE